MASLTSGEITVNLSVSQPPTSPNPEASVLSYPHSVSESLDELSYIISPNVARSIDWSVEEVMKVPRCPAGPTSNAVAEPSIHVTAPPSPSSKTDLLSPLGALAVNHSGPDKSKDSIRHLPETSTHSASARQLLAPNDDSQTNSQRSSANSAMKDWILEDLLRDGELDVDAVSGVLGLDLDFLDEPTPASDSIFGNVSHLSDTTSPTQDSRMGWGRAAQLESVSFDMQIRKPGGPLCVIPEETESVVDGCSLRPGSNRWSSGSLLSARYSKGAGQPDEAHNASWIAT